MDTNACTTNGHAVASSDKHTDTHASVPDANTHASTYTYTDARAQSNADGNEDGYSHTYASASIRPIGATRWRHEVGPDHF